MNRKYLLWDFDHTFACRDGLWSQTIFDLLQKNGYWHIRIEDIHPYLASGFPWHTPELSHEVFFQEVPW